MAKEDEVNQVDGPSPSLPSSPLHPSLVDVLCLEDQFSVDTEDTDVAFVRTDISGDPSLVQVS